MPKKAFVSGCFDLLHSGHVAFFQEAAQYGHLYVAIGADRNIFLLKNRAPINSQAERLYMIKALACVHSAFVARGSGILDFVEELKEIRPDYFIVNEDGSTPEKAQLCAELGIEYVVLKRKPSPGLQARSTTALRGFSTVPESLVLAGSCFDQPSISRLAPGSALTVALSTPLETVSPIRATALDLWGARIPVDRPEKLAKILFGYRNLPGTVETSGAAEAISLAYPGLARAEFTGGPWPVKITSISAEETLRFIESNLYLRPLSTPQAGNGLACTESVTESAVQALADSVESVWQALLAKDLVAFGNSLCASFEAQQAIAPHPATAEALEKLSPDREHILGWQISGGNLLLVSDRQLENALPVSLRRADD